MATKKRKSTKRRTAARRKKAEQRLPAGLGTLFGGLLLMVLAFVRGDSVWRVLHDVLFGLFGCGSFVLGAAVCYLAILYTRGQDLLMQVFKLLLGLIFAMCGARALTILSLGDETARGLGLPVEKIRLLMTAAAALLAAGAVSIAGLISFVGLVVPHIVRLIIGSDYKFLIPGSALLGAGVLVLCDTLGRTVFAPVEIPAGIIMAFLGAPFFLYLLRRSA